MNGMTNFIAARNIPKNMRMIPSIISNPIRLIALSLILRPSDPSSDRLRINVEVNEEYWLQTIHKPSLFLASHPITLPASVGL